MKFKISFMKGCIIHKGHFYWVGQKVMLNVDKLINEYKNGNQIWGQSYVDKTECLRNDIFTIKFISSYYPSCTLEEFWHVLDLDDLIWIKQSANLHTKK